MRVELLAPAGTPEALRAAIENGADAVYLSGPAFGARKTANRFTEEDLAQAVEYCHTHRARVYVTVNTLIFDHELEALEAWFVTLDNLGVDAALVQDLGALSVAQRVAPNLPLHASTQMTVLDIAGARAVKKLGITRAVLARELSLSEIQRIVEAVPDLEFEVFAHGALCYGYSGQCLFSSLLGGRSGNRGECAQPCRLPYSLNGEACYPLSLEDRCTLPELPKLAQAGVHSLKIEGRLKRPEYVAAVVSAYRRALDGEAPTFQTIQELKQLFNRGFSAGYLTEDLPKITDTPGHQGLRLGEAVGGSSKYGRVDLSASVNPGDELLVEDVRFIAEKVEGQSVYSWSLKDRPVPSGEVYRLQDAKLLEKWQQSFQSTKRRVPLWVTASGACGEALRLSFSDAEGNTVEVRTEEPLEPAIKVPLDQKRLFDQLDRLGNTPFCLAEVRYELQGLTVSPRSLNAVRREATEALLAKRQENYPRPEAGNPQCSPRQGKPIPGGLWVHLRGMKALEKALPWIDGVYLDADDPELSLMHERCREAQKPVFIRLGNTPFLDETWPELGDGRLAANVGQFELATLVTDYTVPCVNQETVRFLADRGVSRATLSVELNSRQIKALAEKAVIPLEVIVHGRYPLLTTRRCFMGDGCGKRCQSVDLVDRLGLSIPVRRDHRCRLHLYNPKELCSLDQLGTLQKWGIDCFRLELTLETPDRVAEICRAYGEVLNGESSPQEAQRRLVREGESFTRGHWERGVCG